jgi:hypothetical protein
MTMKILALLTGCALIGAATHAAVIASGGYDGSPAMVIQCAAGLGIPVGAVCAAIAGRSRRFALAIIMGLGLLAAEAFALLSTSERVLNAREVSQSRIVTGAVSREAAVRRLAAAEAAKSGADAAVLGESSKSGCKDRCATLLKESKSAADTELRDARAALLALPIGSSANPLADRLGIPAWALDLLAAALASLSVNILGASMIAFAAHGTPVRAVSEPELVPAPKVEPIEIPQAALPLPAPLSTREHAAQFVSSALRRDPVGSIHARELHAAYLSHCRNLGVPPRSDIGVELAVLLRELRLTMTPDQSIPGVRLAKELRQLETAA